MWPTGFHSIESERLGPGAPQNKPLKTPKGEAAAGFSLHVADPGWILSIHRCPGPPRGMADTEPGSAVTAPGVTSPQSKGEAPAGRQQIWVRGRSRRGDGARRAAGWSGSGSRAGARRRRVTARPAKKRPSRDPPRLSHPRRPRRRPHARPAALPARAGDVTAQAPPRRRGPAHGCFPGFGPLQSLGGNPARSPRTGPAGRKKSRHRPLELCSASAKNAGPAPSLRPLLARWACPGPPSPEQRKPGLLWGAERGSG